MESPGSVAPRVRAPQLLALPEGLEAIGGKRHLRSMRGLKVTWAWLVELWDNSRSFVSRVITCGQDLVSCSFAQGTDLESVGSGVP